MLNKQKFELENPIEFKLKALQWAESFNTFCYLDSNTYPDQYHAFDALLAVDSIQSLNISQGDALSALDDFTEDQQTLIPGFISYDLKNEIESLHSNNDDGLAFPILYFFKPKYLLFFNDSFVEIQATDPELIWNAINATQVREQQTGFEGIIKAKFNKDEYLQSVKGLQEHIKRGDIYEVNFCQEFYAEQAELNPLGAFLELNRISPTPFANFFKIDQQYIISATPERFLCRRGTTLVSQPIKGTARRSADQEEDRQIKLNLKENKKERSENVMIVDLVRNDLSRCALPGTVQVDELFGVYSFQQVHQMISTVSCEVDSKKKLSEILKSTFPMGSMTGAPKISAMQLIENYERSKRGVYSGSVGYINANGDFDFNVVIRTILYNAARKYLSYQVGSAITYQANAEQEYEECLLKAKAIEQLLQHKTT